MRWGTDDPVVSWGMDDPVVKTRGLDVTESLPAPSVDAELEEEPRSWAGWAADTAQRLGRDVGVTAAKGVVGIPQTVTGLADMMPITAALPGDPLTKQAAEKAAELAGIPLRGWSGWIQERFGIKYEDTQDILHEAFSPETQAAYSAVGEAKGVLGKIDAAIRNPSMILTTVGEAIPQMIVGGAIGKALKAAGAVKSLLSGAAIGEGLMSAGSGAEQTRAQSSSGFLTEKQVALHAASGVLTALIGVLGGKLAARLGIDDIDVLFAGGASQKAKRNVLIRGLAGAFIEGGVEEAPQSVQEQIASNLATGKPWYEGWDQSLVVGALSGGVMGGAANVRPRGAARMTAERLAAISAKVDEGKPPSVEDGKALGMPEEAQKNRKTRQKWFVENRERLKKEVSDARKIRSAEEEVREGEGRENLRERREKQISPQPAGQVAKAQVTEPEETERAPTGTGTTSADVGRTGVVRPETEAKPAEDVGQAAETPVTQLARPEPEDAASDTPVAGPQPKGRTGVEAETPSIVPQEELTPRAPREFWRLPGRQWRSMPVIGWLPAETAFNEVGISRADVEERFPPDGGPGQWRLKPGTKALYLETPPDEFPPTVMEPNEAARKAHKALRAQEAATTPPTAPPVSEPPAPEAAPAELETPTTPEKPRAGRSAEAPPRDKWIAQRVKDKGVSLKPRSEGGRAKLRKAQRESREAYDRQWPYQELVEPTKRKGVREPQITPEQNIRDYAEEAGLDSDVLVSAAEEIHQGMKDVHQARIAVKREAHRRTGLSGADMRRLTNRGYDRSSSEEVGGKTGKKLRHFDVYASELAGEYPEVFQAADDPGKVLWELLREPPIQDLRMDDPRVMAEAEAQVRLARQAALPFEGGQQLLFPKEGLPGQKNLFDDTGVPDDIVAEPTAQPDVKAGETEFGAKPSEVSRLAAILPETGVGRAMGSFFRRFFTAPGELPLQVYNSKIRKQGRVAKEMTKLKFAATDFRRAIREALGGKELTQTNVENINAVFRGEAALSTVPEEVRVPLLAMRDHIDSLSRQLIAEGVAQGDLVGVITKHFGVYATRSYRIFRIPDWRKQVPPGIRNRAVAEIKEMYPEKTDAEREGILESLLFKGAADSPVALLRGSKLGSKDLGIFMRRKDIPEWLRDLWGEYKDAGVNYAQSVFKMSHLLANHQFLSEVRDAGLGTWLRTEEEGPVVNEYGQVITPIAADSSSVMAPLNGLLTTPEIKAAFEQVDAPTAMPQWLRMLMAVNYVVKYGKTVGSVMTHVRNLVSNVGFIVANGHWRLDKAGKAIWATATGIGNLSSPKWRTYYQRLAELGLVGEDVRAGEIQDALRDASKANIDEYLYNTQERHARKIVNVGRAAFRFTNALYQAEDGVWKVYGWENEKAQYAKAYPEWTESQVEERSAQIVRDTHPTYSKVGAGVKAIRRFPLMGTFVNFPAEVIRTTFHSVRIGMEEMQAPETRAIGAQRLAGTTVALGGLSALTYGVMAALGISGDEDDDLRWFVPPWQENSRFLYLKKKPGNYRYVDLGYSDPHAWLTDAVVAYMRGGDFLTGVANAFAEFVRPFTSEEILAKALRTAASNQTETGGQVYNPKDDLNQQALAVMKYLWDEALEPGTISHSRRIYAGFAGTDPRRHGPTEVLAMTTGQRIQTVDVQHSLGFRIRDFSANLAHIQKIGRKTATSRGTVTGEQVATDRARMEKLRLAEFSEMQRMLGAGRRLGVSPRTIRTMLRDTLSDEVTDELLSGDYSPYQLTPQAVQAMLAASPEEFQDRFAAWHGDDLPQATRDAATPLIANFPIAKPKRNEKTKQNKKKYKTADEYQDAVDQWQNGRDKAKQTLSALDVSLEDARELLKQYWLDRYGSRYVKGTRKLKPTYTARFNALTKLYSRD